MSEQNYLEINYETFTVELFVHLEGTTPAVADLSLGKGQWTVHWYLIPSAEHPNLEFDPSTGIQFSTSLPSGFVPSHQPGRHDDDPLKWTDMIDCQVENLAEVNYTINLRSFLGPLTSNDPTIMVTPDPIGPPTVS